MGSDCVLLAAAAAAVYSQQQQQWWRCCSVGHTRHWPAEEPQNEGMFIAYAWHGPRKKSLNFDISIKVSSKWDGPTILTMMSTTTTFAMRIHLLLLPRCRFLSRILLNGLYGWNMNVMLCVGVCHVFGAKPNCGRAQNRRAAIRNMRINVELSHWMCGCVWSARAAWAVVGGVKCLLSISGKIFIDMCSLENKASTAKNIHRIAHRHKHTHTQTSTRSPHKNNLIVDILLLAQTQP